MTEKVCLITDGKAFYADTLEEAGRMSLVFYPDERVSLLPEDKEFWPIDLRVKDLEAEVSELKKKVQENEDLLIEVAMSVGKNDEEDRSITSEYARIKLGYDKETWEKINGR